MTGIQVFRSLHITFPKNNLAIFLSIFPPFFGAPPRTAGPPASACRSTGPTRRTAISELDGGPAIERPLIDAETSTHRFQGKYSYICVIDNVTQTNLRQTAKPVPHPGSAETGSE
ncbi:hypothetical protein [Burkholderia glumae]|uniref:hypothetical protein n=1 Tax=Burkholderia glumae TaxID=337 RepID=UPI001592F7AC|nr:hypothetical protein [Burkholderia glumae]NVE21458.1 hypothetical protein [Burkholderia glumae]